MSRYQPPFTITPAILALVEEIGEALGRWSATIPRGLSPVLRRGNRIRTVQASLAIENNTLTIEQVTAVLEGKRVLGPPREIQEVRNAFAAYEALTGWDPASLDDLLAAHRTLMAGLMDDAGRLRPGGVGIYRGSDLVHMAPPASRVFELVRDLLGWLGRGELHPLLASGVVHYELEFIHPFADGNGRIGRLWQTLILSRWRPILAYLPVETLIRERQDAYYQALAESDQAGAATPFVAFMLDALSAAIDEAVPAPLPETDQASDQASDQVSDQAGDQVSDRIGALLAVMRPGEAVSTAQLMERLGLRHRPSFRKHYLRPALDAGRIEMTQPSAPSSPSQRYRLTARGRGT